ncbi:hypothetical protein L208DRAFT_1393584 [Tricholoma matsutake]|nr:hypothetical protein L208DRAFT_1393584 [Tricholoma matsutake 945]
MLRKGQPEMNQKMRVWDWVTEKEPQPAAGTWGFFLKNDVNLDLAEVFLEALFLRWAALSV